MPSEIEGGGVEGPRRRYVDDDHWSPEQVRRRRVARVLHYAMDDEPGRGMRPRDRLACLGEFCFQAVGWMLVIAPRGDVAAALRRLAERVAAGEDFTPPKYQE